MDKAKKTQAFLKLNPNSFLFSSLLFFHLGLVSNTYAAPEGGQVVGGSGSINQSGLNTTIQQNTNLMAIDWQSYNVQQNERVQYIQPNNRSISLNRITGNNASTIRGQIGANGQVILVNPNGIFFSPTATINVGGLMASGLDIKPSDFMNGNYIFNEVAGTDGFVINSGIINVATGGNVTLLGKQVRNDGMIVAKLGAVNMAAGKAAVVTFDNTGLLGVRITKEVLQNELGIDPAVLNSGSINAEGGRILLTASVSRDIFSSAVNTGDMEQATSAVVNADGTFTLGGGADVVNTGTLDVSVTEPNATAGNIVMVGKNVTSSGNIKADSQNGNGGNIELHATDTTLLTENSNTSARAINSGKGGNVKVLGNNVGLFDNAQVNASGANGGGTILIGGDKTGQNKQIRNAEFIYLSENSSVNASATDNGNGGKLITFATDSARIYGKLFARGGVNGGNGGFIETSGLKGFEITSAPDTSAANGMGGEWLIDPYNIAIVDTAGDIVFPNPNPNDPDVVFNGTISNSTLSVGLIYDGLDNGNVTISTDGAGTDVGNIILETNLIYTGSNSATLTLNAANDISIIAQQIRADLDDNNPGRPRPSKTLNLVLNANSDNTGSGDVNLTNAQISTNGGSFTATGVNFSSSGGEINTVRNNYGVGNGNGLRGGDVAITTTGLAANPASISIGGNILTDGGAVSLVANQGATTSGTITTTASIDTTIQPYISRPGGGNDRYQANSNTGTVSITADGAISLGNSIITDGQQVEVTDSASFTSLAGGTINTDGNSNGNVSINSRGAINLNDAITTNNGAVTVNAGTAYNSNASGTITTNTGGGGSSGIVSINAQGNLISTGQITTNNAVVNFNTNTAITTGGIVALNGNIATNGGNVTVAESTSYTSTGNINAGAVAINSIGTITSGGQIASNGGNVDLISTGGSATVNQINLDDSIVSNGGNVTVSGGNFISNASGLVNTGSGNITITTAGNITTGAQLTATSGNVNLATTAAGTTVTLNNGISTGGTLDVDTQGAILATNAPLLIGGNATFSNANNNITLNNSANDFQGTVALTNGAGNVAITNSNNLNFATSNIGTGTLTVNAVGITQSGAITQAANGGLATFNAGNGVINLNNTGNNFTGNVALTNSGTNNVAVYNTSTLRLGTSTLGSGALTLNAGDAGIEQVGAIQQTSTGSAGAVNLTAREGSITLQNNANAFIGAIDFSTAAGDVRLTNNADIQLNQSIGNQVTGDLVLSAISGNSIIQQTGVGTNGLTVTGTSIFMVNASQDIVLENSSNSFNGVSFLANTTGTLRDVKVTNTGALDLQALNVSRDLSVTAGGAITNNAGNITVGGLATLSAGGDITLGAGIAGNNVHDFTSVVITSANNVLINDTNGINIGDAVNTQSNITGNLTINANGNITQTAALTNSATATFNAGAGNILLNNADNDFNNLNLSTTGNANIADTNGIQLGNISANGLAITTANGGDITEAASSSISVTGLTTLSSAGAIQLGGASHNFNNLVFTGSNVAINNASAINIGDGSANGTAVSTATNLTLTAQGNITDIGSAANSVTGTANLTAGNGNITLLNTDFQSTLTATAANNITVNDATGLTLGALNAANTIDLTAGGSITGGNLTAASVKLLASNGINATTNTASLDVQNIDQGNTTASGNVNLTNTQAVDIIRLHSFTRTTPGGNSEAVGDVSFTNTGDVTVRAGSIDSGYDEGAMTVTTSPVRPSLDIVINNGNLFARANTQGDINNADITAFYAIFNIQQGNFGWPGRQLVLNLKRGGFINAARSVYPQLTPPGPSLGLIDNSDIAINFFDVNSAAAGEQLISVEKLEDIDPAIFTDVRNYTYGQIAIRLPRDQLFEDELQELELKEAQGK